MFFDRLFEAQERLEEAEPLFREALRKRPGLSREHKLSLDDGDNYLVTRIKDAFLQAL